MTKLTLTYAETRRLYGSETFNPISRFVREIPQNLIQEVRLKSTVVRPGSYHSSFATASASAAATDNRPYGDFYLGQIVKHPIFGEGAILNFEGQGASTRVQVNFENAGCKWLVVQFAKLEAVS
jgi:DNA helicase II / ATP-dependent DNA helicase PcrA